MAQARYFGTAGKIDFLHVSYTEWKSKSSFKTYGRSGKAKITDPRESHGMEALVCDRTRPEIDRPETTIKENAIVEFPGSRIQQNRRGYWLTGPSATGLREPAVLRII
jgi:hypothetical protein